MMLIAWPHINALSHQFKPYRRISGRNALQKRTSNVFDTPPPGAGFVTVKTDDVATSSLAVRLIVNRVLESTAVG